MRVSDLYLTPARTGLIMLTLLLLGAIVVRVITASEHSKVRTPPAAENGGPVTSDYGCQRPERIGWNKITCRTTCAAAMQWREERYLIVAFTVMTDVPEAVGP